MVALALKLSLTVLVVTCLSAANGQIVVNFIPRLFPLGIGNTWTTGFALEYPICIFDRPDIDPTFTAYLVVSFGNVTQRINITNINSPNFPSFQGLGQNLFFLTLPTPAGNYRCLVTGNQLRALQVGVDPTCLFDLSNPACNGLLVYPGPYRVKFIVVDANGNVIAETLWSDEIYLRRARDPSTIDTYRQRSAGMISITAILSILLAGLFAGYTGLLFMNCYKMCCGCQKTHNVQSCPNS